MQHRLHIKVDINNIRPHTLKFFAQEIALAVQLLSSPEYNPSQSAPSDFQVQETVCLARNIYHEARGEPETGQKAVAFVTINRSESKEFPRTICGVVQQPSQFSWVRKNRNSMPREWAAYEKAMEIAADTMHDKVPNPVANALYFHASSIRPSWTNRFKRVDSIGRHVFLAKR